MRTHYRIATQGSKYIEIEQDLIVSMINDFRNFTNLSIERLSIICNCSHTKMFRTTHGLTTLEAAGVENFLMNFEHPEKLNGVLKGIKLSVTEEGELNRDNRYKNKISFIEMAKANGMTPIELLMFEVEREV